MANPIFRSALLTLTALSLTMPLAASAQALETTTPTQSWSAKTPEELRFGQVTVSTPKSADPALSVNRLMSKNPSAPVTDKLAVIKPSWREGVFPLGSLSDGLPARHRQDYGAYMREPAYAEAGVRTTPGGPAMLSIGAVPNDKGFCGLWMRIYDNDAGTAVDASDAQDIAFWIKGTPNLPVEVKLADAKWQDKQDSLLIGPLSSYLPGGRLTGDWQQVRVPIPKHHHNLKPANLTQLVFDIKGNQRSELMIHSVALLKAGAKLPARLPEQARLNPGRAVWLWQSEKLLDPTLRGEMLEALARERIQHVFVQLAGKAGPKPGELILTKAAWQPAITAARAKGIQVHALDGDPRYALPEWHEGVLSTVRGVLAYNASVPAEARFAGIQYDIEPYLLSGYFGSRQQELMEGMVRLVDGMSKLRTPDFKFGLAAPFWLDSPDEFTGEWPWLKFKGKNQLLSEHLIERVDYLALMNYRTRVQGNSGLLANIRQELAVANRLGKGLWVGLETTPLPHETSYTFKGTPQRGWPQPSDRAQIAIARGQEDTWRIWWIPGGAAPPPAPQDPVWHWPLHQYSDVKPEALSFASLGWPKLRSTVEELEYALQGAPSFHGVILHDQQGVQDLIANKPGEKG